MRRLCRPLPLWLLGLTLLAATAAWASWALHSRAADEGHSADSVPAEGVVCTGHVDVEPGVTPLYPSQPGRVSVLRVREDEAVKAGQELLRLDDRPARFLVRQAEEDLRAAEAQLADARNLPRRHGIQVAEQEQAIAAAQHRLAAARHVLSRKRRLAESRQVPQEEVETAAELVKELEAGLQAEQEKLRELELADPSRQVARAEADVAAKQARRDQARYALAECSLRAPEDGKVLRLLVSVGEMLGTAPRQPAVQFCPAGPRIVRAEVEQEFAGRVAVGQAAVVTDDSRSAGTWHGRVLRLSDWYTQRRSILQEPLQFNDVRTLECIIQLDAGGPLLRLGQRVRVTLTPPP